MNIMDRRRFLGSLAAGTAGLAACSRRGTTGERPPNFVFILVDDLGWRDLGCYGSTFYETPAIDALASRGVRFTDAYAACPVCSPTRASIMTGKYPARLDITEWIGGNRTGRLVGAPYLHHLPLEETTIAEALGEAGYLTFFAGKWHLGDEPWYPEHQGFDINIGGHDRGSPPGGYFSPYRNPRLADGPEGEHLPARLTDESIAFLRDAGDAPFLLYLSFYSVHTPLQGRPDLLPKYERKAAALNFSDDERFIPEGDRTSRAVQDHAVYAAMIQSVDESVGRIVAALDELGLANDTVIMFMSDNGGLATSEGQPTSNLPLRAGKGWLYEGGIREPMFIAWPGVIEPGVCATPVTSTDFYPTMLDLAGLPPRPGQHVDGLSLKPLLTGSGGLCREAIFWHYPHYSNQGGRPGAAVRAGDYKLIEHFEDGRVELYDLADDLGERHDLAGDMPGKAGELARLLHDWQASVDARMPTPNPDWTGSP